ncbi:MAG: hypothetical protein KKE29_02875 [Proteobacteria bacterium]|nr:hypothetical protein [Pseudomonadota bacterium]
MHYSFFPVHPFPLEGIAISELPFPILSFRDRLGKRRKGADLLAHVGVSDPGLLLLLHHALDALLLKVSNVLKFFQVVKLII